MGPTSPTSLLHSPHPPLFFQHHSLPDPPPLVAEAGLSALRHKGTMVLEQMCGQQPWTLEEAESPVEEQQDNVQHVQAVMDEMQLRKQR